MGRPELRQGTHSGTVRIQPIVVHGQAATLAQTGNLIRIIICLIGQHQVFNEALWIRPKKNLKLRGRLEIQIMPRYQYA